jgi:hypothetical protein
MVYLKACFIEFRQSADIFDIANKSLRPVPEKTIETAPCGCYYQSFPRMLFYNIQLRHKSLFFKNPMADIIVEQMLPVKLFSGLLKNQFVPSSVGGKACEIFCKN